MKYHFAPAAWSRSIGAFMLCLALLTGPAFAGDLRLIMFEETGCIWCARWKKEIGPAYPNTEQGAAAPLTMLNIHDPLPEGMVLDRPAYLTPTFVLLSENSEVGRIEGYPGPEFFWFLLDEILAKADLGDS